MAILQCKAQQSVGMALTRFSGSRSGNGLLSDTPSSLTELMRRAASEGCCVQANVATPPRQPPSFSNDDGVGQQRQGIWGLEDQLWKAISCGNDRCRGFFLNTPATRPVSGASSLVLPRKTVPLTICLPYTATVSGASDGNYGEILVQTLTFTCPQTGRVIDTGVNTDALTLASVQGVTMRVQCPHCGMRHQFPIEHGLLSQPLYWPSRRICQWDASVTS
jgi:hypothetical protein